MADEKDTEASGLALEKFIPEFNCLSMEGPSNDDTVASERPCFTSGGPATRRIRLQRRLQFGPLLCLRSTKEFGRDTHRLNYFPVTPLEVSYDSKYDESDYYGGGSSHSGQQQQQHQQQSVSTIILDTDDLRPTDSNVTTQEENIPNIGLGTIENVHAEMVENIPNIGLGTAENVHAEKADIGQDKHTKLVHYFDTTELSNCIIWFGLFALVFWFSGLI